MKCLCHNLVLSSFMTYHWIHNTTGVTSPAGSAYPSGAPKFNLDFQWDSRCSIFSFFV